MAKWSIVKKSYTEKLMRSDPEYFDSKYDKINILIDKHKMKRIGDEDISKLVTDGDHGNPKYLKVEEDGTYYIKSKDLTSYGIDFEKAEKVSYHYAKKLGDRCSLHEGEVLLSTVGTIGIPCITKGNFPPTVLSRDIAKIVPNKDNIFPEYLYLYLATEFSQLQMEREISGSVQEGLYLHALKKIAIHKTSSDFQNEIKKIVEKMIEFYQEAQKIYNIGKKAIEISINNNEQKAMEFLNKSIRDS